MHCCARCGRNVYVSEAKLACNKLWHSFCFSCYKCRKLLPDGYATRVYKGEIFCNACYCSSCLPEPTPFMSCHGCCSRTDCDLCCNRCVSCKKPSCQDCCSDSCYSCGKCCLAYKNSCRSCCVPSSSCCESKDPCIDEPCCRDPCQTRPDFCPPKVICTRCCKPINVKTLTRPPLCYPCSDTYCLQPTSIEKKCNHSPLCLDDGASPSSCMSRYRSCSPACCTSRRCSPPPCCRTRPASACITPIPRDTVNYYNRNHKKCYDCNNDCCCCASRECGKSCDSCVIVDCQSPKSGCPPKSCKPSIKGCLPRCLSPPKCGTPPKCSPSSKCCPPSKCCSPPKCCPPSKCPPSKCCPPKNCCSTLKCDPCCTLDCPPKNCCSTLKCNPCCTIDCTPQRRPICYPPLKCCEPPPMERICYFPGQPPIQYCSCCCASKPCTCDINYRRRQAICHNTPRCRRCGRKVYAAEKIMASGGAFHSCCFSCFCCRKPLEVTNVWEGQGEIYCKCCYVRYFGPQGYGYGLSLQTPN